ncbi:uncharacterized protein PRCAT00001812001 [Priceomyces carsonii]|uniref:uncharacterized protein n=1 Tax=Priceomyces carsonii TaxID=28549 RepID=UPI002ED834DD|nr:unnamed protein product [Priceomyces carsonii]
MENVSNEDIWADDDELHINPNADLERNNEKRGYLEGLTKSQEESLQKGFDDSYPYGAELGMQVGKILAQISANCDGRLIEDAKKELNISKILNKMHFDENLQLIKSHPVIEKWTHIVREETN